MLLPTEPAHQGMDTQFTCDPDILKLLYHRWLKHNFRPGRKFVAYFWHLGQPTASLTVSEKGSRITSQILVVRCSGKMPLFFFFLTVLLLQWSGTLGGGWNRFWAIQQYASFWIFLSGHVILIFTSTHLSF